MTLDLGSRLDQLQDMLASETFLSKKGLGNELAFYIFDYEAECEPLVAAFTPRVKQALLNHHKKLTALEINLYNLIVELLEMRGFLQKAIELEHSKGSEALVKGIGRIIRPDNLLEPIQKKLQEAHHMVFLTGVGAAWPLLRSHTILNNLHPLINEVPLVMFYPGRYSGNDLSLFAGSNFKGFTDDNYYRAFPLIPRPEVGL